jgi:hypothetical protein
MRLRSPSGIAFLGATLVVADVLGEIIFSSFPFKWYGGEAALLGMLLLVGSAVWAILRRRARKNAAT